MNEREAFLRLCARFDELAEFMDEQGWIPARAVWGAKEAYAYANGRLDYKSTTTKRTDQHLKRLHESDVTGGSLKPTGPAPYSGPHQQRPAC
jgi:hypothetical protein